MVNWDSHPPAEKVLRKVWQRDIASVPVENETSLSFPPPLSSNSSAGAGGGGRDGPGENLAFKKQLPNQLARERRAPPSPAASSPCPLLASLPFSISLPSPPRQGVRASPRQDRVPRLPVQKSRQGRRAEEKPKWREKKESRESPGVRGQRAAAAASTSDLGTWTQGRKTSPGSTKAA